MLFLEEASTGVAKAVTKSSAFWGAMKGAAKWLGPIGDILFAIQAGEWVYKKIFVSSTNTDTNVRSAVRAILNTEVLLALKTRSRHVIVRNMLAYRALDLMSRGDDLSSISASSCATVAEYLKHVPQWDDYYFSPKELSHILGDLDDKTMAGMIDLKGLRDLLDVEGEDASNVAGYKFLDYLGFFLHANKESLKDLKDFKERK